MSLTSTAAERSRSTNQRPPESLVLSKYDDDKRDGIESDRPALLAEAPCHPWRVKGPILLLSLLLAFGSDYAAAVVSPLKSTLKKELGIDNAQYAVIDTANSLINTVVPILSGAAIDYYGPIGFGLGSCSFILLGAVLTTLAVQINNYPLMVVAEIIKGLGNTTVGVVQVKFYSWYCAGMLALAYGLGVSLERIAKLVGKLSAVPVTEHTGHTSWAFWVAAIICAFSWACMIALFLWERSLAEAARVPTGRRVAQRRATLHGLAKPTFRQRAHADFSYLAASLLALPACFWLLDLSQLLQTGVVLTFNSNLADAIRVTRGATTEAAGFTSAIGQVMPIVLTPFLGAFFDRFGHRMHLVTATASLYILVFCLLAYTQVNALVPSILSSLGLVTNVLPWIVSVPLLVGDQRLLGTAYGVYQALANCGTVVVSVASGAIQDRSGTGPCQYRYVFAFWVAVKALDVVFGLGYIWFDRKYLDGVLVENNKQRSEMELAMVEEEHARGVRKPIEGVTRVAVPVVAGMVVLSWVLYLYYSV